MSRIEKDNIFFLYKINNTIRERNLLQPYQKILIAVSGGQDSICLLRTLSELKKQWNWKLGIVHCDHRWNLSSKFQAELVAFLAVNLQINYYEGIAINSVQKEGDARNWRYNIQNIVALSENYTAIITGHNASDRIETLLSNITRGSGLHGLQSINWKRHLSPSRFTQSALSKGKSSFLTHEIQFKKTFYDLSFFPLKEKGKKTRNLPLIRPFLETTRTEIRTILNIWKLPSWSDRSNKELRIRRNRIRHRIIPYIRMHYNPKIDQILTRWAEIVQSETFYLEQLTNYILSKIEIKKKMSSLLKMSYKETFLEQKNSFLGNFDFYQSAIPTNLLRSLPLAIQRRLLKQYIYKNTGRILGFQYIEQIRLFCLFQTYLSSKLSVRSQVDIVDFNQKFFHDFSLFQDKSVKKKKNKIAKSWIVFPSGIKLLIRKNYIFLFSPISFLRK